MSIFKSSSYIVLSHTQLAAPADSTTYYFACEPVATTTTATLSRVYLPSSGVIRKVTVLAHMDNGKIGASSEAVSIYLNVNGSDNAISTTATYDGSGTVMKVISNTSLNIVVNSGSYMYMKVVTPAWTTNPTTLTHTVTVQIDSF